MEEAHMYDIDQRAPTPPDHPAYGVKLTTQHISSIVQEYLPDVATDELTITALSHEKSWNNRIYFVASRAESKPRRCVLKAGGKETSVARIQNEVACLLLLQRACPEVPVPRVVAWSTDGHTACQWLDADMLSRLIAPDDDSSDAGWILMTCLDGESLDADSLDDKARSLISQQLAEIVSGWRSRVPRSGYAGNLRFDGELGLAPYDPALAGIPPLHVGGILEVGVQPGDPIRTPLQFWRSRLSLAIHSLATNDVFATNRANLLAPLHSFAHSTLPQLQLAQSSERDAGFIFTHTDLSPRNVLVSGSPPRVSGIVDFEYSGFFPEPHEFTGKSIVSLEDDYEGWPVQMHSQILGHLEDVRDASHGQSPLQATEVMEEYVLLVQLENYIAPWWISSDMDPESLKTGLADARAQVEKTISKLQALIG